MYEKYKKSRNAAWEIMIDYKINSLPVQIQKLCADMKIDVVSYQSGAELIKMLKLESYTKNNDGFAVNINNRHIIFYDNTVEPYGRLRFTVAHELGHIVLGHIDSDNMACRNRVTLWNQGEQLTNNELETQANIFASRLLAPAFVLHELHIYTVGELMALTGLSRQASQIRLQRMAVLEERNKFYSHPLERKLKNQFENFINNYNF